VLPNGIAYLKREIDERAADEKSAAGDEPLAVAHREEGNASGHEVKPKFRDPATGETWSGRGRMATWLKRKQDTGEDIEKYRV
jgi:DNA-binding protein H-NS